MSTFSDRGLAFIDLIVNGSLLLLAGFVVIMVLAGVSRAFIEVRHWLQMRKIERDSKREAEEISRLA